MNAPAQIPAARDKYIPIVKQHFPVCEGEELSLRCSVLMIRDQASKNLQRCSEDAWHVLNAVQRLANEYAYADIPVAELADLRRRLLVLTSCASGIEAFAYRLAYPEETGGTDARG